AASNMGLEGNVADGALRGKWPAALLRSRHAAGRGKRKLSRDLRPLCRYHYTRVFRTENPSHEPRIRHEEWFARMKRTNDQPVGVKCGKCGLTVQVRGGGRRLCGCGTWLAAEEPVDLVEAEPALDDLNKWPRIEGDLSAIERLNDGYRRICREMNKAIVGQQR